MHRDGLYAAVLESWTQVGDYFVLAIPAEACFDGDGERDGADHAARDFEHLRYIAQHPGTGSFAGDFLYRTAEVDVYEVRTGLFHHSGGLFHSIGVAAVNLYGHGAFAFIYIQLA